MEDSAQSEFEKCTKSLSDYLTLNKRNAKKCKSIVKKMYDNSHPIITEVLGDSKKVKALPQLIVNNFDDEQIWQQLELHNDPLLSGVVPDISKLVCSFALVNFDVKLDDDDDEEEESSDESDKEKDVGASDDDDDDDLQSSEREEEELQDEDVPTSSEYRFERPSVVDDKFFRLRDMTAFLEQEEAKEMKENDQVFKPKGDDDEEVSEEEDDDVDYFAEIPSDEEGVKGSKRSARSVKYNAFFDDPNAPNTVKPKRKASKKSKKEEVQVNYENGDENEDDINSEDERTQSELKKKLLKLAGDYTQNKKADKPKKGDTNGDMNGDQSDDEESSKGDEEKSGPQGGDKVQSRLLKMAGDYMQNKEEEDDENNDAGAKSRFEQEREKTIKKLQDIESKLLERRPWELLGEVESSSRPNGSILQKDLVYDHQTRQVPIITEDTTKKLESIILQRIKDKSFDDVERKIKPADEVFEYRRRVTLNQEKSKQSLSKIYEEQYLKQEEKKGEDEELEEHKEIGKLKDKLFGHLDALFNYHFSPKVVKPELKVVNNLPSITVEEITPAAVSDGDLLAPEEIRTKSKREVVVPSERTQTDKNRARRVKKHHQRTKERVKEEKLEFRAKHDPEFAKRLEGERAVKKLKHSTNAKVLLDDKRNNKKKSMGMTSTKFFAQLQEEVTNQIQVKTKMQKKAQTDKKINAAALKL